MTDTVKRTAKNWALKALARRMHTVQELERGLANRGCPPDTVDEIVSGLKEQGYIDDRKFAEMWVASRSERRLHGRFRLLSDLLAKGVDEEIADAVIHRLLPIEKERVFARKAARKKARTMRVTGVRARAALQRHLRSRGYQSDVVWAVLSDLSMEEEQP
jgi:regulatory protein